MVVKSLKPPGLRDRKLRVAALKRADCFCFTVTFLRSHPHSQYTSARNEREPVAMFVEVSARRVDPFLYGGDGVDVLWETLPP